MDWEPVTGLLPDQDPEATHDEALTALHFNVELVPLVMLLGAAEMLTVGVGALTDTVTDWVALPPSPVQVKVYVALTALAPVDCEPLSLLGPDQAPDDVQALAFAVDQLSVEALPESMVLGLAMNLMLGAAMDTLTVAVCEAPPPSPEQVSS